MTSKRSGGKYSGQVLSMIARIMIEKISLLENKRRNFTSEILEICNKNEIPKNDIPSNVEINRTISSPQKFPSLKIENALIAVVESLTEKLQKHEIDISDIEVEAERRVENEDFGGKRAGKAYDNSIKPKDMGAIEYDRGGEIGKICKRVALQLGIREGSNTQKGLVDIGGHYLILRYIFTKNTFVVSYMNISNPMYDINKKSNKREYNIPSWFKTKGGEDVETHDFNLVRGVVFAPDRNPNSFISIGQVDKQINIRSAILTRIKKPSPVISTRNKGMRDLYGIRLSFGSTVVDQVAHRIWCTRIPKGEDGFELRQSAKTYSEKEYFDYFRDKIDGFQKITDWICATPSMTMKEYNILKSNILVPREPFDQWMHEIE